MSNKRRFELQKEIRELERDIDALEIDVIASGGTDLFYRVLSLLKHAASRLEQKRAELAEIERARQVPVVRRVRMEMI